MTTVARTGLGAFAVGAGVCPGPFPFCAIAIHDVGMRVIARSELLLDARAAPSTEEHGERSRSHDEGLSGDGFGNLHLG